MRLKILVAFASSADSDRETGDVVENGSICAYCSIAHEVRLFWGVGFFWGRRCVARRPLLATTILLCPLCVTLALVKWEYFAG